MVAEMPMVVMHQNQPSADFCVLNKMASPQLEKGYTKICNELLEQLVATPLPDVEHRLLLFIIRKTYGYNKKSDKISLTQFEKALKRSRPVVSRGLKNLLLRNMVVRSHILAISPQKDYEKWVVDTPLLVKNRSTSRYAPTENGSHAPTITSRYAPTHKRKYKERNKLAKTSFALKVNKKEMRTYNENESYQEPTIDAETLEYTQVKKPTKKYPNASKVFSFFGKHPANWKINKTQLQAAENLYTERGSEQILKALNFYKENKEDKFCPVINSPYDLDSKWNKLISFKKRK